VPSQQTGPQVGAQQVEDLLGEDTLPFGEALCVEVADSAYSVVSPLGPLTAQDNLVTVTRMRSNRTVYRKPAPPEEGHRPPGHPTWYGTPFRLKDPTTWGTPDQVATTPWTTKKGRRLTVHLQAWHDLLMRGTHEVDLHTHPFTVIRIRVVDENGDPVFQRPLWLMVIGKRRGELSPVDAFEAYRQRYDLEHFFRFGKQRLLIHRYQTPTLEHEENWWQIVLLAYLQLWLARSLAHTLARPWERYLPRFKTGVASPATVQRDFGRIIRQIGTPAQAPKPRGYSPGRPHGHTLKPRITPSGHQKAPPRPQKKHNHPLPTQPAPQPLSRYCLLKLL